MKSIKTERLMLRPWLESDLLDMYEYTKDRRVTMASSAKPHESIEEAKKLLDMIIKREGWYESGESRAIVLKSENKVVGGISIAPYKPKDSPAHLVEKILGFEINPAYWGQGLAPEAAQALIKDEFEQGSADKLWLGHFNFNVKSKQVITKLGFKYAVTKPANRPFYKGQKIELVGYTLTKEEWQDISSGES